MKRTLSLAVAGLLAISVLAGCGSKPQDAYNKPAQPAPAPAAGEAPKAEGKLMIGQLPVVDGLPFWIADKKGYFKQEGVEVVLTTFNSANERDAAIISGDIDGMLADPIATTTLISSGTKVKITSLGLGATKAEGPMAIIAAPGSGITKPEDLKGVEIAISKGSVMDFVTEKLLLEAGLKPEEIKTTGIPQINLRYEALTTGKIKAAILPEPWLSLAANFPGTKVILHDATAGKLNYSLSVIPFSEKAIKEKPNAIKRFFIAYNRAVNDIRLDPQGYMDLIISEGKVPEEIKTKYKNVAHSMAQAPKKEDLESVVQWLVDRKIIKSPVSYEQLVDASLLPQK
ncbi:MAG TPA: MetQ/NlpA family ABC transporter substrate-binding protein [Symbiobacteriaceae bacterium]|nr:MetQ/NlpA family ABC transporter substrate-binding protein [Symbiobacteriaceae bacterium]